MSRRLTLLTYRKIVSAVDDVLRQSSARGLSSDRELAKFAALCCPGNQEAAAVSGGGGPGWRSYVQQQFRMHSKFTDKDDIAFQRDIGMAAIRYGRSRAAHLMKDGWKPKASSVQYSVGDVFHHKKWGYTGVVFGWDTACQQSEEWQRQNRTDALDNGPEQPFFHALVHAADCGVKDSTITYVAQENIQLKAAGAGYGGADGASEKDRRAVGEQKEADEETVANLPPVVHPDVGDFFTAFCPLTYKYVPRDSVREEYPED